jgi:CubicO group peptidase (beta-lactamase class C family)
MKISLRMLLVIAALVLSCVGQVSADGLLAPENLKPWLESVRVRSGVPALGVAIVMGNQIISATTGFRKFDDPTPVTDDDAFHLASCTKSMTATVLAFLVDEGKLKWDSTLSEIFPDLADGMRPEYRGATVRQVLNQLIGLPTPSWPAPYEGAYWRASKEPLPVQRALYVKAALAAAPEAPVGTKFIYSNRNFVLAGAIAERVTGKSWETLIQERLFDPLDMKSAGFGPTASQDKLDGIWGHLAGEKLTAKSGPRSDNSPVLRPAASVHCSMEDWAKYARFVMRGVRGEDEHLSRESFAALTTPPPDSNYAFGWWTHERSWGGGTVLFHHGTITYNYCVVWIAPLRNFAVLVATNVGESYKVCNEVATALVLELDKATPKP